MVMSAIRQAARTRREAAMDRADDDEVQLTTRLARGEREAAERLVDLTYGRIYGLLCKLCEGDADTAAELTQETYRRAWAGLAGFSGRARFSTWLYRIAYNTFLNHSRRPRVLQPLDDDAAASMANPGVGPEQEVSATETARRLRRAVAKLPEKLRFCIAARFWAELPASEIALAEGVSEVAVRKRLRKAVKLLAGALAEV
jgi:RNA polymerase sigma-70 factor (ECF subfamily)